MSRACYLRLPTLRADLAVSSDETACQESASRQREELSGTAGPNASQEADAGAFLPPRRPSWPRETGGWPSGQIYVCSEISRASSTLDAEIPHSRLQLRMPEQQLNCTEVLCSPVDQHRLGAPDRVRAVVGRIESQFLNPGLLGAPVSAC